MKIFRRRLESIIKGSFARNVSILAGGTALAQLTSILILPVLTRIYSPSDFGILAVYTSLVSLISVVSCLRLEIAIPIPEIDEDAIALLILSFFSVILVTLLTVIGIIILPAHLAAGTQSKLAGYIWLIPLAVFLSGIYNALQYWATRNKAFILVSKTRLSQAISGGTSQVALGYIGMAPLGLLIGHIVNISSGILSLNKYLLNNHINLLKVVNFQKLKSTFKKYERFPRYSVVESFANTGAIQIPIILIAYYAVSSEAGFMMLAMRLLSAPIGLIGGAIGQVYLADGAQRLHKDQLKAFTHKTIYTLVKLGLPPLALAAFTAPFVVPIIFGDSWSRTGVLISWMTPWFFMQLITSPVSMSLHLTSNQRVAMILQIFGLFMRVGTVLVVSIYFKQYIAEFYALTGFLFYTLYLLVVLLILRDY